MDLRPKLLDGEVSSPMSSMNNKLGSSKSRPFCFIEFYEHAQASAAYATYHCTVAGAARSSSQDGAELTLDWADPLRFYIHMHASMTRQHGAADNDRGTKQSATITTDGHSSSGGFISPRAQQLQPEHRIPRYRHVPQLQPACGPAVQQLMSQEGHLLMRQQLPLPSLPPALTSRTSRSFNSSSSSSSNSHCSNSSSFFSSNIFSEPQPRYRRLQLPPIDTRFCDLSSPSMLKLQRVWPHVQAQNSDYLARFGLWT
eukprot:13630-Heterococcus_DN1.PRE.5